MGPIGECAECKQLWSRYRAIVMEQVRVSGALQLAMLRHDRAQVDSLKTTLEGVAEQRISARRALEAHRRDQHAAGASAAADGS